MEDDKREKMRRKEVGRDRNESRNGEREERNRGERKQEEVRTR